MVNSMTGFGRGRMQAEGWEVTVEIRTVNHRYFEYSSRLPRQYAFADERLKELVQQSVARGKTEVFVSVDNVKGEAAEVRVNVALAEGYHQALMQIAEKFNLSADVTPARLAGYPDVLSVARTEPDEEQLWQVIRGAAQQAIEQLVQMRRREGERLAEDVTARAALIAQMIQQVEQRSPQLVREHTEKLEARMRELIGDVQIDPARLLTEAALFADKTAVAEETVRLRSHLDQLAGMLQSREAVGRKIDFLVQEINRETNTIGSKIQDIELTRVVVDMKAEIEKIREQIQNIE